MGLLQSPGPLSPGQMQGPLLPQMPPFQVIPPKETRGVSSFFFKPNVNSSNVSLCF